MNYQGIILGIVAFMIFGLWHPIVVKGEYYLGKKVCIFIFIVSGIIGLAVSLFNSNFLISAISSLWGFTSFWAILEVIEQEERVAKGWFPKREK